jgi:hypothetical protein
VDVSKYCKEQDIEVCALKVELTALNIFVVTVYRDHVEILINLLMDLFIPWIPLAKQCHWM